MIFRAARSRESCKAYNNARATWRNRRKLFQRSAFDAGA
jgi:hypothetical protein